MEYIKSFNYLITGKGTLPVPYADVLLRRRHRFRSLVSSEARPVRQCIHKLFESQVEQTPNATALIFENQRWSYRELNHRANQLAHHLQQLGVKPEVLVGIFVERSMEMLVALLGVLKAGGGYVPLDPTYPQERLAFMLEDTRAAVLLTQKKWATLLPSEGLEVVCLDTDWDFIDKRDQSNPASEITADNVAYVIYTSGSTGKPKGVVIPHGSITSHCLDVKRLYNLKSSDRVLQFSSFSFDASVEQILSTLISGACLVLRSSEVWSATEFFQKISDLGITIADLPTAYWRQLAQAAPHVIAQLSNHQLRLVIVGGEAMIPNDLTLWQQTPLKSVRLLNVYGPTETTITATAFELFPQSKESLSFQNIPIGRPLGNRKIYILNKRGHPVPIGVPGELYIGGAGLARGYLNRPELTAEKFIPDPFSNESGARMYKTGDLVRSLADGNIEFLGRIDNQVKIRGFRIELGEIEAALTEHESVGQAVVTVREDGPGDKYLTAYVIPALDRSTATAGLGRYLRSKLPEYMLPRYMVELEAFPLLPNGKIDRKALPAPQRESATDHETHVPPRNPTEEVLVQIWADVLAVPQVGIYDDFFDLGGNSLLAVRLMAVIQQRFGVELPLQALFETPTVAWLADKLSTMIGAARTDGVLKVATDPSEPHQPRTATEHHLLAIWERLLNIRPVGIHDNFLELQGRAVLLDQMLVEVRSTFGMFAEGLPVNTFVENPTIATLARIIDNNLELASPLVVCLQSEGSKCPLFLIHAGGGYVFFYRALASRLGPDRPVYGVRAETKLDKLGHPFVHSKSIEDLATRYITEIKTVQPKGPYALGGGCLGGVIAFEMARQLQSQGEEISGSVLLFDAFVNNPPHDNSCPYPSYNRLKELRCKIATHLRFASRLGRWEAVRYLSNGILGKAIPIIKVVIKKLKLISSKLMDEVRWSMFRMRGITAPIELIQRHIFENFLEKTDQLLSRYVPGTYEGNIVLFKAEDAADFERLWARLPKNGITVHEMPGKHLDMMEEPTVITIAALVRKYLG